MFRRFVGPLVVAIGWAIVALGAAPPPVGSAQPLRKPDVWFVPTPLDVVDKMLELAAVKKTDAVYDLGSGDGRIVITAAKRFGCKAVGVDLDPELVAQSRAAAKKERVDSLVRIDLKDLYEVDLSNADVVTLFLLPEMNVKLIPQLEKLKPGARIVCNSFPIFGVQADKAVPMKSASNNAEYTVYLYTAPLKKEQPPTAADVPDSDAAARTVVLTPAEVADYQEKAVVSRTLLGRPDGNARVVALDHGEELTEKAVAFETLIHVLEGEVTVTAGGQPHLLRAGQAITIPPNESQSVLAGTRAKLLVVMIR